MVLEVKRAAPLSVMDWKVLGHEFNEETPLLPRLRINVPFGARPGDMHVTANKLAQLAEALHTAARTVDLGCTGRMAIAEGMQQVRLTEKSFYQLKKDWETELRQEQGQTLNKKEKLRIIE